MLIRLAGKLMGCIIASILSPTWPLMNWVLSPYFNIKGVLANPQLMPDELTRFQAFSASNPQFVMQHLIPEMIGVMVFSILFMIGFSAFFGWLAGRFIQTPVQSAA